MFNYFLLFGIYTFSMITAYFCGTADTYRTRTIQLGGKPSPNLTPVLIGVDVLIFSGMLYWILVV